MTSIDKIIRISGGVLKEEELRERLFTSDLERRLAITPMIDPTEQINEGSVDVRLGTEFVISKKTRYSIIDPKGHKHGRSLKLRIPELQEKVYTRVGKKLVLHPSQFALGCTLEYIRLPCDVIGYVIGRSSWGRLGLVIATATYVHPGFAGVLTLELVNLGDTPIALYPGIRIAQLTFHKLTNVEKLHEKLQQTKYLGSISPEFSRIYEDNDWEVIKALK